MNDIDKIDDIPSTTTLTKQGITAVTCTAGGLFLLLIQTIARLPVLGLIIGGIACVVGIVSLLSNDPTDKKAGIVISGAGILLMLSKTGIPLIRAAAGTLISFGSIGLLALGILNGIKFLKGLKRRS